MRFCLLIFCLGSLGSGVLAQKAAGSSEKPVAIKAFELGRVSNLELAKAMARFWKTQFCNSVLFISSITEVIEKSHVGRNG